MGDENSLQGRTQAHKHSSLSSDGSFLAEGTTGTSGGLVGEVWTQTATEIPEWASVPAPASGAWVSEGSSGSASATASLTVSGLTDADVYQVIYSVSDDDDGSSSLTCVINGDTGGNYYNIGMNTPSGTGGVGTGRSGVETNDGFFKMSTAQSGGMGHSGFLYVYKANSNFTLGARRGTTMRGLDNMFGSAVAPQYVVSTIGCNASITAAITSIQLIFQDVSQDIIGDMRVNSLTY